MLVFTCQIPQNVSPEILGAFPNVNVNGKNATFTGISEDKAVELINRAIDGKRQHIVKTKAAIRPPESSEMEIIRGFVDESEEVEKYSIVVFEVTNSTPDTSGERIMASFQKEVLVPQYKAGLPFLFQHDHSKGYGKTFDAYTEEVQGVTRTIVKSYIPNDFGTLPNGESPERNIKTGVYDMSSISWFPTANTWKVDEIGDDYIITNFYDGGRKPRVIELSLVASGMHPDAKIQRKSIEFKTVKNSDQMEVIKFTSFNGEEVELKTEIEVKDFLSKVDSTIKANAEKIESLSKSIEEVKSPIIDEIQNIEATLKLKSLDEEGMKADREKREKQTLETLRERVTELKAMKKAAIGSVMEETKEPEAEKGKTRIW